MSNEAKTCPRCGSHIPENAPGGLCPKCLLAGAAATTGAGATPDKRLAPPSIHSLAAAFPQLEIVELIGQGGMGFVYRARQPKLDRDVALKILPQAFAGDPAFAERFAREGRLLARLNHPNIVSVYDFGQANGFFYLLMEFVDGVNLRQAMRASRFTPGQALTIVPQVCEALQYAHDEGVLHRDIKPENILLDTKGRVKIADFGIAKMVGADQPASGITASGAALGTPHYMAPEQIEKPAEVDHRADIYSLGVVFYELLTGELPLGRFALPSAKTPVNAQVDEVVLKALEKERERRQQSAGEMKTEVETASKGGNPETASRQTSTTGAPDAAALRISPEMKPLVLLGLVIALAYGAARPLGKIRVLMSELLLTWQSPYNLGGKLIVTLGCGLFGYFLWLVWKYRQRLLAPFGIAPQPSVTRPGAETSLSLDGVLYLVASVTLLVMTANLMSIILLPVSSFVLVTTGGARFVLSPAPLQAGPFGLPTNGRMGMWPGGLALLVFMALSGWLAWRDSKRHDHIEAPVNPPAWLKRAGLLFFGAGVLALFISALETTPSRSVFHSATFAIVTGVALLTRDRTWRSVALALNWLGLGTGLLVLGFGNLLGFGNFWIHELIPGGVSRIAPFLPLPSVIFLALGLAYNILFIAGLWVLNRPDVLPEFGLARKGPIKNVLPAR